MITVSVFVVILSLAVASLFFYIYHSEEEPFLMFFGFSWIFYSLSLICLLFSDVGNAELLVPFKKLFDMYSLLTLLYAVYKYFHLRILDFWIRFSIYLVVWFAIAQYLHLDSLTAILPIFAFDGVMIFNICRLILIHFKYSLSRKITACFLFVIWGSIKGYLTLFEVNYVELGSMYFVEILYTTLLTMSVLLFYLLTLRDKLETTEQKNRIILDNARDAFFYLTLQPNVTLEYITPAIQDITGYGPQSFYGKPSLLLEIVEKQDFGTMNRLFFTEPEKAFPTAEVVRFVTKNNEHIWVEVGGSLIWDDDKPIAVDGYFRNIDQMKNAQDDLIESKKSQEVMFSYVSHELKTPVTILLGYATALKDGTLTDKASKQTAIEAICDRSLVLERMIEDLSLLSQLQTKQFSFAYEYINCADLAESIHQGTLPTLRESGIRYTYEIASPQLAEYNMIADPIRINQVMTNLVVNSIKYTRPGNHIRIKIDTDKSHKNVIITISDKGIGISSSDLPHIFENFFKSTGTKESRVIGRGLGLAISKEIVEAHGGEITARSRQGKGTTFTITLPVHQGNE